MAVVAHVVYRTGETVEGLRCVVVAIDDTVDTTDALVRARASSLLQQRYSIRLTDDYFDSNIPISDFDAAGDIFIVKYANEIEDYIS